MNNKMKFMLTVLALGASAFIASAQNNNGGPNGDWPQVGGPRGPRGQGGPGFNGPGPNGQRPPLPPLMQALDVNHDGVIDADEIANAPAALKALDKNGDGKLTQDELRPPRPQNEDGAGFNNNNRPQRPPPGGGPQGGNNRPQRPPGPPPNDGQ